jgi:hypothetical protein
MLPWNEGRRSTGLALDVDLTGHRLGQSASRLGLSMNLPTPAVLSVVKNSVTRVFSVVPRLFGWWLRRQFPETKCRERLRVAFEHLATFQLAAARPSSGLSGVQLQIHNYLPFAVQLSFYRIQVVIGGVHLLDSVLNNSAQVSDYDLKHIDLGEISINEKQADWVRGRPGSCLRATLTISVRVVSAIRSWEQDLTMMGLIEIYR